MSERVILPRLEWHILTLEALGNARSIVQNEQLAMLRELLAARPLLEAVRGATRALEVGARFLDIQAAKDIESVGPTMPLTVCQMYARAKQEAAVELRRIRELVDKT